MGAFARRVFLTAFLHAIRPSAPRTVSDWAGENRILSSESSAEPGRWRNARTPFLVEIMDKLSEHSKTEKVVFMKCSQIGGSEVGLNWIGYVVDHAPGPALIVQPTLELSRLFSKQRLDPMLNANTGLRDKVGLSKSKDRNDTILHKDFPGGTMRLAGANSAASLRSMPVKYLMLDEVDAYPIDVEGEGDPISLADKRTKTFAMNRKIFIVSSPKLDRDSKIASEYNLSDQRHYMVPCPHCEHYQQLVWERLSFDSKTGPGLPVKAQYQCENCDELIDERHKGDMLAKGQWVKFKPDSSVAGFHINALYSPPGWTSWGALAREWIDCQGVKEKLKAFVNSNLGLTWQDRGDAPDHDRLYERREDYEKNVLPNEVAFLTAGVDVQKDRLELEIVGWANEFISWSIDYRVINGKPTEKETWNELAKVLQETFPYADKRGRKIISAMGVDSGYETSHVYAWVRKQDGRRVFAIKGDEALSSAVGLPKPVEINLNGKRIRRGVKLWPVGVSKIKSELFGFLKQSMAKEGETDPVGYCHFPQYDEHYFKMLTAEEMKTKIIRGYPRTEWIKIRERNEALDARVYARAAAAIIGQDRFKAPDYERLAKELMPFHNETYNPVQRTEVKVTRRKSDSGFWD
jgi:phage terminase large subunit GpA-like protein